MRACAKWDYHLQSAHYKAGALACGLGNLTFIFAFVESNPPYGVRLLEMSKIDLLKGKAAMEQAGEIYYQCVTTGRWPSYPDTIETAELPKWARG